MKLYLISFSFAVLSFCFGQNTVGLNSYLSENTDGYVLFAPNSSTSTYLIDKCGSKVKEWVSTYKPGLSSYLLPDGSLLRTGSLNNSNFQAGGSGGIIEKFDWDGNLVWSYSISDDNQCQHHDICPLPNGNVLAIVWERKSKSEAIANGKNTSYGNDYLWSENIIEIQPSGSNGGAIVWEWKVWDHLVQNFDNQLPNYDVVSDHPELININYFPGSPSSMDWIHFNSIDYNPENDQILLSSHTMNEIWIIDHSTTISESASHTGGNNLKGGDLLYRWGNPIAYQRGNVNDKKLFGQHHATWIPQNYPNAGKVLVFNNGLNRPEGDYSSVDMLELPIDDNGNYSINSTDAFLPLTNYWSYTASTPTDFYGSNISGCYPLDNGNFLITNGTNGDIFEIDNLKNKIWEYINPVSNLGISTQGQTISNNILFRANFYPINYSAFTGKLIQDQGEIELNPTVPSICDMLLNVTENIDNSSQLIVVPNPANEKISIDLNSEETILSIVIIDQKGNKLIETIDEKDIAIQSLENGIYILSVLTVKNTYSLKFIKNS